MSIDSDIKIDIRLDGPLVSSAGFSLTAIIGKPTFSERSKLYTPASDVENDTDLNQGLKDHINGVFAHPLKPDQVLVGRRDDDQKQTFEITINAAADEKYSVDVNGTSATYTGSTDTTDSIATSLASAINALAEPVTASAAASVITVEADTAGEAFTLVEASDNVGDLTIAETQVNISIKTELSKVLKDNSFYGFSLISHTATDIERGAEWAETNKRLFFAQTEEVKIRDKADSSDIASTLEAASYEYSVPVSYEKDSSEPVAFVWAAAKLSLNPDVGSTTFKHLNLNGIAPESLDADEVTAMRAKNCNFYTTLLGQNATADGVTSAGRKIDLRLSADWFKARLEENFVQLLVDASNNNEKVGYDNSGMTRFEQVVRDWYKIGVSAGHFVDGTLEVEMNTLENVPSNDRKNRELNFKFGCQPKGAIEGVNIVGNVSVDFDGF